MLTEPIVLVLSLVAPSVYGAFLAAALQYFCLEEVILLSFIYLWGILRPVLQRCRPNSLPLLNILHLASNSYVHRPWVSGRQITGQRRIAGSELAAVTCHTQRIEF